MRKLSLIFFSGLFFAVPAAAQDAAPTAPPPDKVELKDTTPAPKPEGPAPDSEPAPPAEPSKANPAPSPVTPETTPAAKAKATEGGAVTNVSGPAVAKDDDSWKFEYHGYIRAPMRVGMGKRVADPMYPNAATGTSLHAPVIPDDQYLSWASNPHNKTDWAELYISLGNSWAKGTVSIQGYDFYQGSFANAASQLGVSDGYIDLTPDLGYENVRLAWRVGSFSNKYGSAGKYDAGEYDTYMFGRIHNSGEALHIDYDIDEENSLWFEHGIGVKKPDPSQFNNARFTMLDHFHVGFKHTEAIQFSAHYMDSWSSEEMRTGAGLETGGFTTPLPTGGNTATSIYDIGDGKMWTAGVDGRFDLGAMGYLYAAYSHVGLKDALTVSRAIEVIHASGGGEFGLGMVDNYLGPSCVGDAAARSPAFYMMGEQCSLGNGGVDTLLAQYEFSLTNFSQMSSGGQKFWGDGPDLYLKLYGMYNKVKSDVDAINGIHKLKYGADLAWSALPWLTAAVRFDRLQPNSRIPEQSFSILSPRLVFKSKWLTREAITLQYSRYMYNKRTCNPVNGMPVNPATGVYTPGQEFCAQPPSSPVPPTGFGASPISQTNMRGAPTFTPDENVFKIEATMWW
ncbi:MAG TPA: hypothetical protein VGM44_17740 [Polyangiaceae bacterium]|jgi:hypothetical protein